MKIKKPLLLVASFVSVFTAAAIGSSVTFPSVTTWYITLNKSVLNPPSWVFGPVWTILYILMAIALYLVWREGYKRKEVKHAVTVFFIHLAVNALWSIVFFGLKNIPGALIVIVSLWLMILYIISRFAKINKTAAILLVPYLLWVTFATILNYSVWILNR